jgi:hypothetical protein
VVRCKNGHENPDGATYCAECHVYIDTAAEPVQPEPAPEPEDAPAAAQPVVTLSEATLHAIAGEEASCTATILNPGGVADAYALEVSGPAAWSASVEPRNVALAPGAQATTALTFRTERDGMIGPLPFELRALSAQLPELAGFARGVLDVAQAPLTPVVPEPEQPPAAPHRRQVESVRLVSGVVRDLEQRVDWGSAGEPAETTYVFRVALENERRETIALVPVEMRGLSFRGSLSEGDGVEIESPWRRGETLRPGTIVNLTTGGRFESKGSRRGRSIAGCLVFLLVAGAMAVAFYFFAS